MTRRKKRPMKKRVTKSALQKLGTIDPTADYQDLMAQYQAMRGIANRLATELNEVQVTLTKFEGAMEYLKNRGAKVPNVEDPDKEQQPTE